MAKQTVPDIEFKHFALGEIADLFAENKILINTEYQRGDVWKARQKNELIKSILDCYSIGVIVLFKNEAGQYEILDGQQRLLTICKYLRDELDLSETDIPKYSGLSRTNKMEVGGYSVYYLKLKSHNPDSKEEDIVQTFLRLQEGSPLNKAEKINAHRGEFKNVFRMIRETHKVFYLLGPDKRFRWRQLAAELLLLELETDFKNKIFPSLDLGSMIDAVKKYEKSISTRKKSFMIGNLDLLHSSLNYLLTGFQARELVSFYLLVSYLRRNKADNANLTNELAAFAAEFLKNVSLFGIYDTKPPVGMDIRLFNAYKTYKLEAKIMTTSESLKKRFEIILGEFQRLHPFIQKDEQRLHDIEQKRTLYFRQKGLCSFCGKSMEFKTSSSHHIIAHRDGGKTSDLTQATLLHEKCHVRIEKQIQKSQ